MFGCQAKHYEELRQRAGPDYCVPDWLAETAAEAWGFDLDGKAADSTLLIREPTKLGFARASVGLEPAEVYDKRSVIVADVQNWA
ncbi:hypothetical protein [Streptomyces sp. NBC_00986]|uniref:hypothetical protein n=1 Tax=Streptomyces sp. NBC_00986 TaxID=2903702 RepID=UPI0038705165|nr:hypothetical protein OG504_33160 [Streptomyces sp. NBC_00986]